MKRRTFLELGIKTVIVIGTGHSLQSFAASQIQLPPKNKVRLRFALASDGHFGQPNTKYQEMHDEMVNWLNAEKTGRGLDLCFINGDLYHDETKWLPEVKKQWDKLTMPYYVSHGNHDHATEQEWTDTFGKPWHYTFDRGGATFLVLNTADEKGNYICPDVAWAKEHLEKLQSKKHLFVVMHITPFKWTKHGIACKELTDAFAQQQNLRAVFHGHDHDQDDVKQDNGKPYFFDAHIAGNWGTEYRGYRIVELLKNGSIITYQMNPAAGTQVNSHEIKAAK